MRKRLVIIGVIVIVLAGAVALVLVNLGGLVNRNKDFLLSRAESSIGREVSVGEIGVTLRGGIGVRLSDVSIADDPSFSSEPFLQAKELQVNAKLLPLFRKEFEVKRVVLREPVINLIRNEQGNLNVDSFGGAAGASGASAGATQGGERTASAGAAQGGGRTASAGAAAPLIVSLVNIDGGTVRFVDKMEGMDITVSQIKSRVESLPFAPVRTPFEEGGSCGTDDHQ